jgi:hypothetical protein
MPLCIAGMHRSGTSMIASLLCGCGLDLGPQDDMLAPAPNNPEGFWESRSFLRLNDAILKVFGGAWDRPPLLHDAGWEKTFRLHPLRLKAKMLVRRFANREPWGWKDPRNSLTFPFWKSLLPNAKVLICLRNPLAVAESLAARDGISPAEALDLWFAYNRTLWTTTWAEDRLVTHCDSYLDEPRVELRRVLDWCGLYATEETLDQVCGRIKPTLVHHHVSPPDLAAAGASPELLALYSTLCVEASTPPSAARSVPENFASV